jgi:iron-sulfur cluster insertion protein
MITFTAQALKKITEMAPDDKVEYRGIRVMVLGGGCAGFTYDMDFEEEPREDDWTDVQHGWNVYVDPMSQCYLEGTTVDYIESLSFSGFHFANPGAKSTCGCGSSFN